MWRFGYPVPWRRDWPARGRAAGAAGPTFRLLDIGAGQGWTRVGWFHFAAGRGKANQGFVAWDGEEPTGGRIGLLMGKCDSPAADKDALTGAD